jgi:hypothetical protein
MDDIPGWVIVGVILGIVFLINFGLIREGLRSRGLSSPLAKKSIRELLIPWDAEDHDIDELHRRISNLDASHVSKEEEEQAP